MATKKNKVETPIDQRETFVSLQKNFTDSEVPIEEKLKTLYDLQQADRAIDDLILRRGELPSEVEAIEEDQNHGPYRRIHQQDSPRQAEHR